MSTPVFITPNTAHDRNLLRCRECGAVYEASRGERQANALCSLHRKAIENKEVNRG